jgi:hypothetical protein
MRFVARRRQVVPPCLLHWESTKTASVGISVYLVEKMRKIAARPITRAAYGT